jgi:hypothetical protein
MKEHESKWRDVAATMARQLRPRIDRPIDRLEIKRLLEAHPRYWPHTYALGLMAAVDGKCAMADDHLKTLREVAVETSNAHIAQRCEDLQTLLALCRKPDEMQDSLRQVEAEVLKALRLE